MMRMAIVIRVQHLEHMSAELEHSHHYSLPGTSPTPPGRRLPAASPYVIVVCHVNVKDQFFLLSLESSQLHCIVLTGLQIQNTHQFLSELPCLLTQKNESKNLHNTSLWGFEHITLDLTQSELVIALFFYLFRIKFNKFSINMFHNKNNKA